MKADIAKARQKIALSKQAVEKATVRALNKTIDLDRVHARREIQKIRPLKAKVINSGLKVKKATAVTLTASLRATGRPIALKEYGARRGRGRPRKPRRDSHGRFAGGGGVAPVTVQVTKGGRKVVQGGFIGRTGQVLKRIGGNRSTPEALIGPSLPGTFKHRQVQRALVVKTRAEFPRLVAHEFGREAAKLK